MKRTSFLGVSSKRFNPWVGKIPWRRKWQSTPVLLPGKSHGQRSLVGYSSWGHKELDMTERLHFLKGQTAKAQEPPRGATPRPRSGAAAGSYPMPPSPRPGQQPGGATPRSRPGAAARRTNPTSKELWLRAQECLEELSHVEGQKGRR